MSELEWDEARELLIGTWIGIALMPDALIETGALPREKLLLILSQAEAVTSDRRGTALAGLRLLVTAVSDRLLARARGKPRSRHRRSANAGRRRLRSVSSRS